MKEDDFSYIHVWRGLVWCTRQRKGKQLSSNTARRSNHGTSADYKDHIQYSPVYLRAEQQGQFSYGTRLIPEGAWSRYCGYQRSTSVCVILRALPQCSCYQQLHIWSCVCSSDPTLQVSNEFPWCCVNFESAVRDLLQAGLKYQMGRGYVVLLSHFRDVVLSEVHFVFTSPRRRDEVGSHINSSRGRWSRKRLLLFYRLSKRMTAPSPHFNHGVHYWSRDSVVGIVFRLRTGRSGIPIPAGSDSVTLKTSRPAGGPTQPSIQWPSGFFPREWRKLSTHTYSLAVQYTNMAWRGATLLFPCNTEHYLQLAQGWL